MVKRENVLHIDAVESNLHFSKTITCAPSADTRNGNTGRIRSPEWPSSYSATNPIENMWDYLKRKAVPTQWRTKFLSNFSVD